MIEFRQKDFGKKEVVEGVLNAKNWISKASAKAGRKKGARQIANSLNKSHEARKIAEIAAIYKDHPELAKRELKALKASRKRRKSQFRENARKKLDAIPDNVKTRKQISEKAKEIADRITAKNVVSAVKEAPKKAAKSVMKGIKNLYENTGQIFTKAGASFREHPIAYPGWFSGDVVNLTATAMGHPEMVAVPVGSIAGGVGLAGEMSFFPRKMRRGFRQSSIKYRKRRESGAERRGLQRLTPAHDWSIKDVVQRSRRSAEHRRAAGNVNIAYT